MTTAPTIRLGLLRLTDAAPVVLAQEHGLFREYGLSVSLSVEPSWSNIADKLSYGLLDGAVMLPPLALAASLGLRGATTPLVVPMGLSLNGNSVTLATGLADEILAGDGVGDGMATGRRLAGLLGARRGAAPPKLAVVHAFSTHNLLLRYWLSAAGIDPDCDVSLVVIPPAQMVDALKDGTIAGFCAGAPWGEMAARAGLGRTIIRSSGIWHNHPEKCLAVGRAWADAHPEALQALLRAILQAARSCDSPEMAPAIAGILARRAYLGVSAEVIRTSLPGVESSDADSSIFFGHAATYPWRSHASWFLREMTRWGYVEPGCDTDALADSVYRPDLYAAAARAEGMPVPAADRKAEGIHDAVWQLPADRGPIAMAPDLFCDHAVFETA